MTEVEPIRVLVVTGDPIRESLLDQARAVSPRLVIQARGASKTEPLPAEDWRGVEVLYTTGSLPRHEDAPGLRWVQAGFAGADGILASGPELFRRVRLTTASGIHAPNMAEYILMMMLAYDHKLPRLVAGQARHEWPAERWELYTPHELRDKTVGIIGYGSIGREVARLARAFGMRVLACKRNPEQRADTGWRLPGTGDPRGDLPERIYALDDLPAMLAQCDYVALTAPLTPNTRHVVNARTLAAMKPGAFLVNVGRGGLVDEAALLPALQSGPLAGAALDVFEHEPLPADSPLWSLPNLILSPHISGMAEKNDERAMELFAENLRRYVSGEALLNEVQPGEGY